MKYEFQDFQPPYIQILHPSIFSIVFSFATFFIALHIIHSTHGPFYSSSLEVPVSYYTTLPSSLSPLLPSSPSPSFLPFIYPTLPSSTPSLFIPLPFPPPFPIPHIPIPDLPKPPRSHAAMFDLYLQQGRTYVRRFSWVRIGMRNAEWRRGREGGI